MKLWTIYDDVINNEMYSHQDEEKNYVGYVD